MDGTDVSRRPPFGDHSLIGERGAHTQQQILDAALEVFRTRGYHDATVELVTEAAGFSRPTFYQYFSNKQDVFWRLAELMAEAMDRLAADLPDVSPDTSGVDELRRWLGSVIRLWDTYGPILTSFQAASRDQASMATGARAVSERVGSSILRSLVEDGDEPVPEATASLTVSVLIRSAHYWRLGLGGIGRRRFVSGLARCLHRLLHGPLVGVNVVAAGRRPVKVPPEWPSAPGRNGQRTPERPRGRRTRQRLLEAGRAILPVCGYHETRIDDIVEHAGVSHGSFYRYFASKEELFEELAGDAAMQMVELIAAFPDGTGEALVDWLERWFASYRGNGGIISAWQEIGHDDPVRAQFSLEVAAVAFDRLTRIVHRRGFGDATVDAIVLLAIIERVPYSLLVLGFVDEPGGVAASAYMIRRSLLDAGTAPRPDRRRPTTGPQRRRSP